MTGSRERAVSHQDCSKKMASVSPWKTLSVYTDNSVCNWMFHHSKVSPKMARMLTFFSQFDFVLHHEKERSNVVADALSCPVMSREHSDEFAVPLTHVPDVSYVVHVCIVDCNRNTNLFYGHIFHSALILLHSPSMSPNSYSTMWSYGGSLR